MTVAISRADFYCSGVSGVRQRFDAVARMEMGSTVCATEDTVSNHISTRLRRLEVNHEG